jgi:heme exporter protein C
MYGNRLRLLSLLTAAVLIAAFTLAAFTAPLDADQGFSQKIFYVHVPMAIVALGGFVFGGIMAVQHLRTRDPSYDLKSYVAIHLSVVLGVGVLITGSIWAKAAWGVWFEWREPTLVSFLIVFLL